MSLTGYLDIYELRTIKPEHVQKVRFEYSLFLTRIKGFTVEIKFHSVKSHFVSNEKFFTTRVRFLQLPYYLKEFYVKYSHKTRLFGVGYIRGGY